MKKVILTSLCAVLTMIGCQSKQGKTMSIASKSSCPDEYKASISNTPMVCSLTSPELQKRKAIVLASLKNQILERKELNNGYAYKFAGTDAILEELVEFIKTERTCCNFFTFDISTNGSKTETWLHIIGAEGAKDVITSELEM